MSRLEELHVQGVRNLAPVQLARFSRVNLVYGTNGSGKTSFLEAIHLLGLGKSFRTAQTDTLIANDKDQATVFAAVTASKCSTDPKAASA